MRIASLSILAAACSLFWSLAHAQTDILTLWASREHWRSFDWSKTPASPAWRSPRWNKAEPSKDVRFQESRSFAGILQGRSVEYRSSIDRLTAMPRYRMQIADNGIAGCNALKQHHTRSFGQPISRQASYTIAFGSTADTQMRLVDETYQWLIGGTGVTLACVGSAPANSDSLDGVIALTTFRSINDTDRLHPLTAIRCERSGDGDASVLVLVLDEYAKSVRRSDLSPLALKAIFTDATISFSPTGEQKLRYSIDRVTGSLVGRNGDVSLRWTCTKTELGKRQF